MVILERNDLEGTMNSKDFMHFQNLINEILKIENSYNNLYIKGNPPYGKENSFASLYYDKGDIYFYSSTIISALNYFCISIASKKNQLAILHIIMKFLLAHELKHVSQIKDLNDQEREEATHYIRNPQSRIEQDADNFGYEMLREEGDPVNEVIIKGLQFLRSNQNVPEGWEEFRNQINDALQ
ncbi:hypothetical protein [Salsuginibacillus kocurii]|uniref:hypothetical protein n=1 Tax=Salsuginibacillus kocurii TaxID=427078 RepID=UPI0003779797|nr:hypothetical protein [Salsuginibacillus kocurii]